MAHKGGLLVGLPIGFAVVVSAPALERQLNQAETALQLAEDKQALLLGLLAGRDRVQTLLTLLNQQVAGCAAA